MWWINFLHLYQPASIESYYVNEAVKKSYRRLLTLLEKKSELKMTMNISGCLLDRLNDENYSDLISRFKNLIDEKRIELVGSAYFHGFLPRLSEREIKWQIIEQEKVLNKLFNLPRPKGFFIPEMTYHSKVAKIVAELGYKWLILDEISYQGKEKLDHQKIYKDEESDLSIIFRQRKFSTIYPPDELKKMRRQKDLPPAIITAVDGELYGLRHLDPKSELEKIVFWSNLKTATISEFVDSSLKKDENCKLRPSSWESTEEEIKNNNPYALWDNPNNRIQQKLWQLAELAMSLGETYKDDKGFNNYRWHLSRGLASCWFWWASAYDFRYNYGPLAWSPDQVEKGINDLIRAVRSLHNINSLKNKILAENLACDIRKELWENHWEKYWSKM